MYPNHQQPTGNTNRNLQNPSPHGNTPSATGVGGSKYYNNLAGPPTGMSNSLNNNNGPSSNATGDYPGIYPPTSNIQNPGRLEWPGSNAPQPYRPQTNAGPPPLPGQSYNPPKLNAGPPPLSGHSFQPPQANAGPPPLSGHSFQPPQANAGPPLPGQPYQPPQTNAGPPPLPGQQYQPSRSNAGPPSLPGQYYQPPRSNAGPPLPGQSLQPPQTKAGPPPLPGQQYQPPQKNTGPPPLPGQQYQPPKSNAGPPLPGQSLQPPQTNAGPPLPGQPYQPPQINAGSPPLPGQQYQPPKSNAGPPPLPGQQYHSPQKNAGPPPLPGQQYQQKDFQSGNQPGYPAGPGQMAGMNRTFGNMNMGEVPINLLQGSRILPKEKEIEQATSYETVGAQGRLIPPNRKNCNPSVMRCTLKSIPNTQNLLSKVKLPFGLIIHPFKDLSSLPVITAAGQNVKSSQNDYADMIEGSIVRCRRCRTYINPFVNFLEERRWRCNMCYSVNDTPEEFLHHPVSKTYGEPHTRPECTNSTIEFIAPQEYMLRPPQPAVYLILLDVSHSAVETGYLKVVCDALLENLDQLPGDKRTLVGFLSYNRTIHFYRLAEGSSQPQMIVVSDVDDVFIPTCENLLVSLHDKKEGLTELLRQLPNIHSSSNSNHNFTEEDTYSALGAALEVASKLMAPYGGRISVFQQSIPCIGPGKLTSREDPNSRASSKIPTAMLNPATDYYKKMALDCSANQVAIDFFFLNSQYVDIATLSCASRFSAGDVHHYPGLHSVHNPMQVERFARDLDRYFSRKIGFESVMRIRCTKGLSFHSFHGNFFVRSTDLLSLANINPDSGFAVNINIDDPLTDISSVCFQAALLYTSSKGERRIRIHTLCFPIVKTAKEVLENVDCVASVCLLSKMAVDRAVTSSLSDSRDAIMNALVDLLKVYKECTRERGMTVSNNGVYVPKCLKLFPLYIHSLLKHPSIRTGLSTRLDDRVFAMIDLKIQPATFLMQSIHPDLYRVDDMEKMENDQGGKVTVPELLPLSAEYITTQGCYLLDCGWSMYLLVGRNSSHEWIRDVLGCPQFSNIPEPMYTLPELDNARCKMFTSLIEHFNDNRPHHAPLRILRDDVRERHLFMSRLHNDRTESATSLQEFLMHIAQKISG